MSREAAMSMLTGQAPSVAQTSTEGQVATVGPEVPKAPDQGQLDSSRFAQLAKKEAQLVKEREETKRDREAIAAEKAKLKAIQEKFARFEEKRKTDGIAALKELDYTEADFFNWAAAQEKPEPTPEEKIAQAAEAAAEARIKKFEEEQQAKLAKEQAERDQSLITSFKSDISSALEASKEKLEYCAYYGPLAEELAYEFVVEAVRQSQGKDCPTAQEALEAVEAYYEEQDKAMSSIKKRSPQQQPTPEPEATGKAPERSRTVTPGYPKEEQPKPTINKSRTLSNAATATVASTRPRVETREQKRERLMEYLRNGMKP